MKRSIPFNYQELTVDENCSSTLYTPAACPLNPNQIDYRLLQHYYSPPQFAQHPQQKEQCHEYEHVNQFCQHPHQFQPPQQQLLEQTHYLGGYNIGNHYCEALPNYHDQPQEGSTAKVSFWKAFNTVLSDAKGKQQVKENERCLIYDSSAVAVAVENSQTVATAGLPLGECHVSNVSAPPATIGVDQVFSEEKKGPKRSTKKKKRKMKVKEEMCLVNAFFKKLVKRVIDQQEVLQNKFMEVIERMDRERAEREEAWRRQETEIYDREAVAKARERDLASRRESSIVSSIEKITGRSFSFVSGREEDPSKLL